MLLAIVKQRIYDHTQNEKYMQISTILQNIHFLRYLIGIEFMVLTYSLVQENRFPRSTKKRIAKIRVFYRNW